MRSEILKTLNPLSRSGVKFGEVQISTDGAMHKNSRAKRAELEVLKGRKIIARGRTTSGSDTPGKNTPKHLPLSRSATREGGRGEGFLVTRL
jgi:hypothetical protein